MLALDASFSTLASPYVKYFYNYTMKEKKISGFLFLKLGLFGLHVHDVYIHRSNYQSTTLAR